MAYIDGRVEEVALDRYAQADDGSVWYLGEDVLDYSNTKGLIDGTAGTWLAGRDGPPEMIMPADPQVGDVHRAENIPGVAFEEVTIKRIDRTVNGPTGPVKGAMIARELHDDGTHSDKVFAPGYGEFFSGSRHRGRGDGPRRANRRATRAFASPTGHPFEGGGPGLRRSPGQELEARHHQPPRRVRRLERLPTGGPGSPEAEAPDEPGHPRAVLGRGRP